MNAPRSQIPEDFIQEVLQRTDIVPVVERYVTLRKGGANLLGLCPFHGEKSPSFTVSPAKQFYHCFGCGAHGDAIRFLMEHTGAGFLDVVKDLAAQAGMKVPESQLKPQESAAARAQAAQRKSLSEVLERAAAYYKVQLKASPVAIDYLKKRGLSGDIAKSFGLGYAPPGWRSLSTVFDAYDDPQLESAGLVIVHDRDTDQQKRYDRFRDRIMFPIRSVKGEVIGFGGRILEQGEPKYLNSPETPVFVKGRELYGLFEGRTAIRQRAYALVVEGYMDVVALAQWGLCHAVATLGTACTAEHIQKLLRFTDHIVFSFDGDAAGRRAADRAMEAVLPHVNDVRSFRFLFLPSEHDPDSYVRAFGTEAFEAQVKAALPLSTQLLNRAREGQDLSLPEGRAAMLAKVRPWWQSIPEGMSKLQLLGLLAKAGEVEESTLLRLWQDPAEHSSRRGPAPRLFDGAPHGSEPPEDHASEWRYAQDEKAATNRVPVPTAPSAGDFAGRSQRRGMGRPSDVEMGRSSTSTRRTGRQGLSAGPLTPPPPVKTPADHVCRMLLQNSGLWLELNPADHDFLCRLDGWRGSLLRWLDRELNEHGPLEWPQCREALREQIFAPHALSLMGSSDLEAPANLEDLQRAVQQTTRALALQDPLRLLGRL